MRLEPFEVETIKSCLQERLGEQKIDILISRNPEEPIERIARKEGIQL